ncbi:hypothetical protein TNCV_2067571 [Trichonephila clavipes]|uniref:Uncharacterized protein n=1 Tax=Trichonephila clavipes TaxID=2585209 RepID=A0A8X7BCR8_TRICX|nr:hypothetical protein TNCV_2067571 [Trichonephila clavipes]
MNAGGVEEAVTSAFVVNPHPSIHIKFYRFSQMLCEECTWPWGHCLLFELGPTPRLAAIMVKESRFTIGEACLERILSPQRVLREWDNRTQMDFFGRKGRACPGSRELEESPGSREFEEESPGSRELEEESPGSRELEESPKGRRTDIGVKRKDRR